MKKKHNNPEAIQILDLMSRLSSKIRLDGSLSYLSDEQYVEIANGVKKLSIDIYNHKLVSETSHDRLDELTDIMTSIAALDFTKRAFVGEENNHLDYIAIGLNLLCYQLEKQINPLLHIKKLYDIAHESVILTDVNFIITELNPSAEKKLGLAKTSVLHTPLTNYIKDFPSLDSHTFNVRKSLDILHRNSTNKHNFEIYQLIDEGVITGWAFIIVDNIVADTTLKDLSKNYGIDVPRIQHDVMSPLRSLKGIAELGKITACNDDMAKYFNIVDKCRQSIEGHMNDLFDMLLIGSSKSEVELIHFPEIIDQRLNELKHLTEFSKINFNINLKNEIRFYSNKTLVSSILHNLISNAIKYKRDNIDSLVNISIQDVRGGISIEVKDNGVGISQEDLKNIFNAHFRATSQSEGKGLGLYILKEAVNSLGGNIITESYFGVGSSFKVFLPNKFATNP